MLSTIVILSAWVLCGFHSIVINDKLYLQIQIYLHIQMHCMQFNFTQKKFLMQRMRGQAGDIFGGADRYTAGNSVCFTSAHI